MITRNKFSGNLTKVTRNLLHYLQAINTHTHTGLNV